jgi:hypothetical protein
MSALGQKRTFVRASRALESAISAKAALEQSVIACNRFIVAPFYRHLRKK